MFAKYAARVVATALLAAVCSTPMATLAAGPAPVAQHPARKILKKIAPSYPELARERGLHGTVKIEVVVEVNGNVKSTRAIGGHPVLIQAVQEALKGWKYEPGPEFTEIMEFHFGEN